MDAIDNPPAFPLGVPHMTEFQPEWGMSLRDWFASHAPEPPPTWWGGGAKDCAGCALWNFQYADAMLAERSKQP